MRNWRDRDPKLNEAFGTFEANKTKTEAKRKRVKHYKEVAAEIVEAAREDSPDPGGGRGKGTATGEGKGGRETPFKPRGSPSEAFIGALGQ